MRLVVCLWVLLWVSWLVIVMSDYIFLISLFLTHTPMLLTHMHLPWVPISMHKSMAPYIHHRTLFRFESGTVSCPKCNSSDKNSLDSTLLWFSEFLWHTSHQMKHHVSFYDCLYPVDVEKMWLPFWLLPCFLWSCGLLNQSAVCFLWLCLPVCVCVCACVCVIVVSQHTTLTQGCW